MESKSDLFLFLIVYNGSSLTFCQDLQRQVFPRTSLQWVCSGTLKTAVYLVGALLEQWLSEFAAASSKATVRQSSSVSVISTRRVKLSFRSSTTARYLTYFNSFLCRKQNYL